MAERCKKIVTDIYQKIYYQRNLIPLKYKVPTTQICGNALTKKTKLDHPLYNQLMLKNAQLLSMIKEESNYDETQGAMEGTPSTEIIRSRHEVHIVKEFEGFSLSLYQTQM